MGESKIIVRGTIERNVMKLKYLPFSVKNCKRLLFIELFGLLD